MDRQLKMWLIYASGIALMGSGLYLLGRHFEPITSSLGFIFFVQGSALTTLGVIFYFAKHKPNKTTIKELEELPKIHEYTFKPKKLPPTPKVQKSRFRIHLVLILIPALASLAINLVSTDVMPMHQVRGTKTLEPEPFLKWINLYRNEGSWLGLQSLIFSILWWFGVTLFSIDWLIGKEQTPCLKMH